RRRAVQRRRLSALPRAAGAVCAAPVEEVTTRVPRIGLGGRPSRAVDSAAGRAEPQNSRRDRGLLHLIPPVQRSLQPTGLTGVEPNARTPLRSRPNVVAAWWPTLSVRNYLTVIALVAVMPLIALAVYLGDRDARSEREALRTALMSSARSLAAAVD